MAIAPSGFDKLTWDPASDIFLPQNYSADDMTGKSVCKLALQRHLGLDEGASKILVSFSPLTIVVPDNLSAIEVQVELQQLVFIIILNILYNTLWQSCGIISKSFEFSGWMHLFWLYRC